MARPIEEFVLAWEALSEGASGEGWQCINVEPAGPCVMMAARKFPGNEEALLVGFATATVSPAERLPEGRGFEVCRADPHLDGKTWIALTRKESGSRELFAEMVGDVAAAMDARSHEGEEQVLRALLGRIRSWQEFMGKGAQPLGPEAEVGLIGELSVIERMIEAGLPPSVAIDAWAGPLDAPQDFFIGDGAIETKATLARAGFPAKVGSIDQLDDATRSPILVAGVRLSRRDAGRNLPEFAEAVLELIGVNPETERSFSDKLLAAGYHESHAGRYPRRFVIESTRIVEVGVDFPRLTSGNVPIGVRNVVYEIDLDSAPGAELDMNESLRVLGVF